MATTNQLNNVLDRFEKSKEDGQFVCAKRPNAYKHDRFMSLLGEAREKKMIKGFYASLINGEGTYYYTK